MKYFCNRLAHKHRQQHDLPYSSLCQWMIKCLRFRKRKETRTSVPMWANSTNNKDKRKLRIYQGTPNVCSDLLQLHCLCSLAFYFFFILYFYHWIELSIDRAQLRLLPDRQRCIMQHILNRQAVLPWTWIKNESMYFV